ncbi:MAG TPA: hypothetical protein VFD56_03635, partial [Chitinophagaceae bacterium]|nr:hypothetical protein [Chitinophagaceae bacterium]
IALFSCKPNNGVIIITTKRNHSGKFLIKDKQNGSGLPGATIEFVSMGENCNTARFAANDSGEVVTNKLHAGKIYQVTVTSTGYQELSFHYTAAVKPLETFLLERNVRECVPVVVQAPVCRKIRCGMCTLVVRSEKDIESDPGRQNSVTVYPNPVRRSKILIVEM